MSKIFSYLFAILIMVVIAKACSGCFAPGTPQDYGPSDEGAYYAAKQFVTGKLKAPSTAKFPRSGEPGVTITEDSKGGYLVQGYVDAQNSFGAMLRTEYICTVMYQGNGSYKLIKVTIE